MEIVTAIRRVVRGEPVLSPAVTQRLIARVTDPGGDRRRGTARERLALLNSRDTRWRWRSARAGPTPG
jgi:hypothetical protein